MSKAESPTNPPSDPIAELAARLSVLESSLRDLGPVLVDMAQTMKRSTEATEQRFDVAFSRLSDLMYGVERIERQNAESAQRAAPVAAPAAKPVAAPDAAPGISVLNIGAEPGDVVLTPGGSAPEASAVGVPAVAVSVSGKRELGNAQTVIDI